MKRIYSAVLVTAAVAASVSLAHAAISTDAPERREKTRPSLQDRAEDKGADNLDKSATDGRDKPRESEPSSGITRTSDSALALAALDRKIADLDAEDAASKRELGDLAKRLAIAKKRALVRGRAFYKLSRAGMLPIGGGLSEFMSHAMRVERLGKGLRSDLENETRLTRRRGEIVRALEGGAKDRASLAKQRSAMDSARIAMDDEARRQVAFDKAFAGSSGSEFVPVYGAANPRESIGGFAQSKGKLLFPLAGRGEAKSARREGTDGPGLEVKAALGTSVRAVFAGRVAFADRYGPYGRIVILDHGEHYYTVSGNLGGIEVKVGQELTAGEKIGTVGDEGQGAMLYFEVRHRTETVAPAPWLGL
jgi:murein hydrolase activator